MKACFFRFAIFTRVFVRNENLNGSLQIVIEHANASGALVLAVLFESFHQFSPFVPFAHFCQVISSVFRNNVSLNKHIRIWNSLLPVKVVHGQIFRYRFEWVKLFVFFVDSWSKRSLNALWMKECRCLLERIVFIPSYFSISFRDLSKLVFAT